MGGDIPICCMSWLLIDPSLALLTERRSFCLLLRTTSFASIRADFTSPFEASCFTVCLALLVAVSSCAPVNAGTERQTSGSDLPHFPIENTLLLAQLRLPLPYSFFWCWPIEKSVDRLHRAW